MGRAGRGGEAVERSRDEAVGRRRRDRHAGQLLPRRCCVLTQRSTRPKPVAVARPAPLWLWHCHCLCLCLCVVGLLRGNWGKSIKISQESPSRRNVANIKSDKQTNKQTHRHTVTARQGTATTRGDLGISQVGRKRRRPHGPGVAGRNRFSRKLGQAEKAGRGASWGAGGGSQRAAGLETRAFSVIHLRQAQAQASSAQAALAVMDTLALEVHARRRRRRRRRWWWWWWCDRRCAAAKLQVKLSSLLRRCLVVASSVLAIGNCNCNLAKAAVRCSSQWGSEWLRESESVCEWVLQIAFAGRI